MSNLDNPEPWKPKDIIDKYWLEFLKWVSYKHSYLDEHLWHIDGKISVSPGGLNEAQTTTQSLCALRIDEHNFWRWYIEEKVTQAHPRLAQKEIV